MLEGDQIPIASKKRRRPVSTIYKTKYEIPPENLENIHRVGIIPYCVVDFPFYIDPRDKLGTSINKDLEECGKLWFALGVDAQYGELTDCGGFRKSGENVEITAARELYEESLRIFDARKTLEIIKESPVVVSSNGLCIFFVKVEHFSFGFPDDLPNIFTRARCDAIDKGKYGTFMENSLMYWVSAIDLCQLCKIRTSPKQSKKAPPCSRFTFAAFVNDREGSKGGWRCLDYSDDIFHSRDDYSSHQNQSEEESSPSYELASRRHQQKFHPAAPRASQVRIPDCMPSTILRLQSHNHPIMYELLRSTLNSVIDSLCSTLLTS